MAHVQNYSFGYASKPGTLYGDRHTGPRNSGLRAEESWRRDQVSTRFDGRRQSPRRAVCAFLELVCQS
jgi:hypothetical protein